VTLFFISLVSFGDHIASRANEIGRKFRQLSYVTIGNVMKRDGVEDFFLESHIRSVIERAYIGFLCLGKRQRGMIGRLKFYLQCDSRFHLGNIYHLTYR